MNFFETMWNSIVEWFSSIAASIPNVISIIIKILLIFIGARILIALGRKIVKSILLHKKAGKFTNIQKHETVVTLLNSIIKYVVYFVAIIAALGVLGLGAAAGSLLATAGIGGLAISLGAQSFIKDIVNGFFILFEDQFSVGDYVEIANVSGIVESVTIRSTEVRSLEGELYYIPNSNISIVTNHSRGSVLTLADVEVDYKTDLNKACRSMERAAQRFALNNEDIVEQPTVIGLINLGQSGMVLRMACSVKPLTSLKSQRAMLRHIKDCFDEDKIDIPYPHMVIKKDGDTNGISS